MEKCRRMKRPQCTSKNSIYFWLKVLEHTPAVLSLGKLCDENGYSYEWINGQKPHLIKNGIRIQSNTENFVSIVVPGLSPSSSSSSHSSTSMTGKWSSYIFLKLVYFTNHNCVERQWDSSTWRSEWNRFPSSTCVKFTCWTNRTVRPVVLRLQEFTENLVDDRVPEQRDSHASSSHEPSLKPTPTRSVDLGKHSVYTHFPKDRNCEISVRGPKSQGRRAEDALAKPYLVLKKFGDLITADHKVLRDNCESRNNHRYAVVVQDLATQWIQSYPCTTKTCQEIQRSLQKFLEPDRKPKVIFTDNSVEIGKACEDLSWNHCTCTPHRSETHGIAERAVRRVKEGTSAVLLQSGLDKKWWPDSMECDTSLRNVTDLSSDGKTPYERRFGEPFNGPIIPFGSLVEYYPISVKDQSRIHQFGKKVLPGLFLGYALCAGEFGRVTYWLQTLRSWRRWTHRKSTQKDSMRNRWYFPKKKENLFFQSQMDESKPLEEIRNWEHPLWYGNVQFEERVILTFLENQQGLFHHLTTHFWMPVKLWMISGPCQETSYTAITLNQESNFTRREKNHSLFHWNTLTFPELHTQTRMLTKSAASMIIRISMGQEICLILGQVSLSLFY